MKPRLTALAPIFISTIFLVLTIVSPASAASKSGSFSGAGGHSVRGGVKVSTSGGRTIVRLSGNFKTQSGPDLYVYVGARRPSKRIGKLKKFSGSQSYSFKGTAPITSVFIYCKRYSTNFGTARLR